MSKILSRREFDALDPVDRAKFMKNGGTLKDNAPADLKVRDPDVFTRAEFKALTPSEQMKAMLGGRKIADGERAPVLQEGQLVVEPHSVLVMRKGKMVRYEERGPLTGEEAIGR